MRFTSIFTILLAGALTFSVSAKGPGGRGSGGTGHPENPRHHRMMKELNLTEDQKVKLKEIRDAKADERKAHKEKMKAVRDNIKKELAKDTPDASKLTEYATQVSNLVSQQTQAHIDHLMEMKKILTKEQFQKMLDHRWEPRPGGPRHGNGKGG